MKVLKGLAGFLAIGLLAGAALAGIGEAVPADRIGGLSVGTQFGLLMTVFTLTAAHVGGLFVAAVGALMAVHQYATEGRIG